MKKPSDKVAVITGASTGVGLAVSRKLSRAGINIYMLSHSAIKLKNAAKIVNKTSKATVKTAVVDVRISSQVSKTINRILTKNKKIDYLINCAGITLQGEFDKFSERDWDDVVGTNLKGVFLMSRSVWPYMKNNRGGQIITISSASGLQGNSGNTIYCASKFGVNGLMESMAVEGQKYGIKVTTICPGNINTSIWNPDDPEIIKERENMLQTKDIASLVLFILNRPQSDHFKQIILLPFNLQSRITGKTRGPGGKFSPPSINYEK